MNFSSIRRYIEDAGASLYNPIAFQYGRTQDVNVYAEYTKDTPLGWILPMTSSETILPARQVLNQDKTIEIFIFLPDEVSSSNIESQKRIDCCENYARNLILVMAEMARNNKIQLGSFNITSIFKFSAKGIFSGVAVVFSLASPDNLEYCSIDYPLVVNPNLCTSLPFTLADKQKLDSLTPSEPQVQSDWNESDTNSPAFIQNKPDLNNFLEAGDNVSELVNDAGYLTSALQAGDNVSELVNDADYITLADVDLTQQTGATITFTEPNQIYGITGDTITELTGALTIDLTNALLGAVSEIYHRSTIDPIPVSSTYIRFADVEYNTDNTTINKILLRVVGAQKVEVLYLDLA